MDTFLEYVALIDTLFRKQFIPRCIQIKAFSIIQIEENQNAELVMKACCLQSMADIS
jgi:hypothetical protein